MDTDQVAFEPTSLFSGYGIFLAYRQLRNIRDFSNEAGIDKTYSPGLILFGWLIFNTLWKLPNPFWFLSFLAVWPLAVVQAVLNLYWKKGQPKLIARTKYSEEEIAIIVIGGMCWIILIMYLFVYLSRIT